jgi:predicted PurR-regulated permease PerM
MSEIGRTSQAMQKYRYATGSGTSALEKSVIAVIIIGALYYGAELFVPLSISVLLAFALSPVVQFMRRRHIPHGMAVSVTVLLTFIIIFFVGALVTRQVTELGGQLPRYQSALQDKVAAIGSFTGGKGGVIERAGETLKDLQTELERGHAAEPAQLPRNRRVLEYDVNGPIPVEVHAPPPTALQQIAGIIAVALSPLATVGIIVVFVIFLLFKQTDVRDRAIRLLGGHDLEKTTVALDDAGRRLSSYFLSLVLMNAGFGAAIGLGLWIIGIPNPILWGIIAALLRFMPVVGVFIAAAIPVVLAAAVDPGWLMLAAVIALYLIVEGFMNLVVETWLQATSTGLSVLAILLSAAFWTLLWGPIGLLLAVPLTAMLVVLGRHVEGLSFLHVLLGDTPALTPAESFYQRMLAGDPHEAAEHAEKLLQDNSLVEYYDDVVMEGLRLAQIDADLDKLEAARLPDIRDSAITMIDVLVDHKVDHADQPVARDLAEEWRVDGAITCIAGQSALDELANIILIQLLQNQGFKPRLMSMAEVATAHMQGAELNGTRLVVISIFDVDHRGAYLKFLVRRLRRILPHASFLGGFWKHRDGNAKLAEIADIVPHRLKTLAEVVDYCVKLAVVEPPATTPANE